METCTLLPDNASFTPDVSGISEVVVEYGPSPLANESLPRDMVQWATSFAEERMSSLGQSPLTDTRSYATYDEDDVIPGDDNATQYLMGNQPGFSIQVDGYHRKFTIAHEYGHVNSLNAISYVTQADINYCYHSTTYPNVPTSCTNATGATHQMTSAEWSGPAASEGAANWYAAATWHDVDLDVPFPGSQTWPTLYIRADDAQNATEPPVPRPFGVALCGDQSQAAPLSCPPGTSNEWDWMSLFATMRRDSGVSLEKTFILTGVLHRQGNWIAGSPDDSFFKQIDLVAQQLFSSAEYQVWLSASSNWKVDQ